MAKMKAAMAAVLVLERREPGLRRPGGRHQPAIRGDARAPVDQPHPGTPCRGGIAHGRGLYPGPGRQHRPVPRDLRTRRHRHDHRPVLGQRRLDPDPVHHRPGAEGPPVQGRLPGSGHRSHCGQAGPLGWSMPAALGVVVADPSRTVVAISGDYDFQFLLEELAVGAQFKLPYVHVLVNNSYLGLIRQAQRGFEMDYCVQLAFDNINVDECDDKLRGYGVDHVAVAQALGCKALRVTRPEELQSTLRRARVLAAEHRVPVPVVVEVILEKVTNIAMGTEIDNINEFEAIDCRHPEGLRGLELAGLLD